MSREKGAFMKKIPWKGIAIGCAIMTVLVIAKCSVSAGMAIYYKKSWSEPILADPWLYVGIAAALIGTIALITDRLIARKVP